MYLLIAVINDEELLDELITGWLDIGITGATVVETTDLLQLISHHIPIFAGFRSLTSGGIHHNRTLLTAIENRKVLDQAIAYLETLCRETEKPHQGVYFVTPLLHFGRLGLEEDPAQHKRHMAKKLGKVLQESAEEPAK
jgi:nitrogen regulatory protein P-II 1